MAILVTGGAGNVGAMIAAYFARKQEQVVVYDIVPAGEALAIVLAPEHLSRVEVVQGDILDLALLARTVRRHHVDRIVHAAAAIASVVRSNPALGLRVNIEGTNNVFEAALSGGVERVVWTSSLSIFGPRSPSAGTVENDGPFDPAGAYGASKLLSEKAAEHYAKNDGLKSVALRLPAVYGPVARGSWIRWLPRLVKALLDGEPGVAPRSERIGEFLYGDDVARAVDLALGMEVQGALALTLPAYTRRQNDILDILGGLFPGAIIGTLELADVWQETPTRYDTRAARERLGWEPEISLEEGIRRIAECLRAARSLH
jgi:nucleoside-diphosphate-sugar epimerase